MKNKSTQQYECVMVPPKRRLLKSKTYLLKIKRTRIAIEGFTLDEAGKEVPNGINLIAYEYDPVGLEPVKTPRKQTTKAK